MIHGAIGEFTRTVRQRRCRAIPFGELIALGRKHFAALDDYPEARAFWWPRFERIARWFAALGGRAARRPRGGASRRSAARSRFRSARACCGSPPAPTASSGCADGSYAILDYKTGQVPTAPQVASGLSPQLTLEGAILRAGKFPGIAAGRIDRRAALRLASEAATRRASQSRSPGRTARPTPRPMRRCARSLASPRASRTRATPYRSRERPMWARRAYGDYDHLARVREWSLSGGAGDGEAADERLVTFARASFMSLDDLSALGDSARDQRLRPIPAIGNRRSIGTPSARAIF